MKFKRILSLITLIAMLCSSAAYAVAYKTDYRKVKEVVSNRKANDISYEDFTSVAPGEIPSGVTVSAKDENGYITTESRDIGGGVEKNCLVMVDTNPKVDGYVGPVATFDSGSNTTAPVGIEIRFKYEKTGENAWHSGFYNMFSRAGSLYAQAVNVSSDGILKAYSGAQVVNILTNINNGEWWTINFYADTIKRQWEIRAKCDNGDAEVVKENLLPSNDKIDSVGKFQISMGACDGTLVIDYVCFTDETAKFDSGNNKYTQSGTLPFVTIPNPVRNEVAGRTNIRLDNKIKYTTKAPKVVGEDVLVTARNLSVILGIPYYKTEEGMVLQSEKATLVIAEDGSKITQGGQPIEKSDLCVKDVFDVFVPVESVAKRLGFKYTYDAERNIANIYTGDIIEEEIVEIEKEEEVK